MFNADKTLKGVRKSLETGSQVKIMEAVRTLFFHALIYQIGVKYLLTGQNHVKSQTYSESETAIVPAVTGAKHLLAKTEHLKSNYNAIRADSHNRG